MKQASTYAIQLKRSAGRAKRNFFRKRENRWGQDFIDDVQKRLPNSPKVIFDVGGHFGESALRFSDAFAKATVYTFEPSPENFAQMESMLYGKPSVARFNIAIGSQEGRAEFFYNKNHSSMSRIEGGAGDRTYVQVTTVDMFMEKNGIDGIDILKIDTEGYEIEVLNGARKSIDAAKISLIRIECGLDPDDQYHINLRQIMEFLEPKGFRIFGFYEQWEDVSDPTAKLRRTDVAFVARHIWCLKNEI